MDRLRRWSTPPPAYAPIDPQVDPQDDDDPQVSSPAASAGIPPFSRWEYAIFFLLGVSMLWAWNMFLAAAPYFAFRFYADDWTAGHFQSSILTVSTITNLGFAFLLAKRQKGASYPRRITTSLLINIVVFILLAISTVFLNDVGARPYFAFLMFMVFGTSLATAVNQNGVFAYVSGFGRPEYTQAIMGGQGVAGVLPCIVQILTVLAVPPVGNHDREELGVPQASSLSAFLYFITAAAVSSCALVVFLSLLRRRSRMGFETLNSQAAAADEDEVNQKSVSLGVLFQKLRLLSLSVFLCFVVTMMFPVYTGEIQSVREKGDRSRLFQFDIFVPLAFLFWNIGDLVGRMLVLVPRLSLGHRPRTLFVFSLARLVFIPLYMLCNVRGEGAVIKSDFFYLFIVQLLFGTSNGYLSSNCMMGAGLWVSEEERKPAGGFMSMMLVGGLAAGSLLSFFVAGA